MTKQFKIGKAEVTFGVSSYWGIGIEYDPSEIAFSINILNLYMVIQKYYPHMTVEEFMAWIEGTEV